MEIDEPTGILGLAKARGLRGAGMNFSLSGKGGGERGKITKSRRAVYSRVD